MKTATTILLLGLSLASSASQAVDSASFEYATGNRTQFVRLGAQWRWDAAWFKSNGTHLGGYWDATLSQWRGTRYQGRDATQSLTDIGFTPVFRFQNDSKRGIYYEGAVGVHYLSRIYDVNNRKFSTRFQFGDHIGIGYVTNDGWDVALKIQHFSNGSIKKPNPGANFIILKAGREF
ncbi:MAG TPA: acyloxyacyl hydrolase [Paucimonas sp.]|nr:acyloxyacyl hydrolase [Paucimonas sp.]